MSAAHEVALGSPHDPRSFLLDACVGFRGAAGSELEVAEESCALELPLVPAAARDLSQPNGSLGGLRPPSNVALGPTGDVYLLDAEAGEIKRFDPCEGQFARVPYTGGHGGGARELRNARAITIACGSLYVCDTGIEALRKPIAPGSTPGFITRGRARIHAENHRVSVFALNGFGLRGHLKPPKRHLPWRPVAVAVDSLGRAWVGDENGRLFRFSPSGNCDCVWPMSPAPVHLAIDCRDRLYVVSPGGTPPVRVLDGDGREVGPRPERPRDLREYFPRLPFEVDSDGVLWIRTCPEAEAAFGSRGQPLGLERPLNPVRYARSGVYFSEPLDSKIAQCVWHRLVLRGTVPAGTHVRVRAQTSDQRLTDASLSGVNLDRFAWHECATAREVAAKGEWDCLIRTPPGRYLWLELTFAGNGVVSPSIESIIIEFPRVSLRRYLPAVFGMEPTSADFTDRFLALFDTQLRVVEHQLDDLARYFDPGSAPPIAAEPGKPDFLSWLASWIGIALDHHWDIPTRRRFLKRAGALFDRRGTLHGLREGLLLLLDFTSSGACRPDPTEHGRCLPSPRPCGPELVRSHVEPPPLVLEHFRLRRWLRVGQGRLGNDAVVWAERIAGRTRLGAHGQVGVTRLDRSPDPERDPWLVHANQFSVFVPARYREHDGARRSLENLIKREAPAGTRGTLHFVEPRFRIGTQSMLGFDSVIAAVPQGVALGETTLGGASVLTAPTHGQGGPAIRLGEQGRVGTTTLLG